MLNVADYVDVGRRFNSPEDTRESASSNDALGVFARHLIKLELPKAEPNQWQLGPLINEEVKGSLRSLYEGQIVGVQSKFVTSGGLPWLAGFSNQFNATQEKTPFGKLNQNEYLRIFVNLTERWELEASHLPILLGYSRDSYTFALLISGDIIPSTQDFTDRVAYMLEISIGLEAIYGDNPKIEQKWLKETHHRLRSESPLNHMLQGHMKNLITVVDI